MLARRSAPILCALALLGLLWTAAWPFTIDDAFIVARYAERLAHGHGYTYVDGPPSDGVTGPLWLAPLALAARLGVDPIVAAKLLGALGMSAALLLAARFAARRALGERTAWLTLAFGASSLPLVVWATAGLESGAAAWFATWLALATRARPRAQGWSAGFAAAGLIWLRPELLPFSLVLGAALFARERAAGLRLVWLALTALAALLAFRWLLFAHLVPLSAHAKPASLANGASYLWRALASPRALGVALGLALALRFGGRDARVFALAIAVHALALMLVGGDWMPGRRLFAPLVPLLALTLALGVMRFALRHMVGAATFAALLLAMNVHELAPELARARRAGLTQRARVPALAAAVCRAQGPVALIDIGALGVACPAQTLIDLGGLTEPEVAYAKGGHLDKHISQAWLQRRAPALIVLHSRERPRVDASSRVRWFAGYPIERRVLGFSFVQRAYAVQQVVEYADDYFYVLLAPRTRHELDAVKP